MIILVLIPFLLVLLAQIILKITYRKYESIKTDQGLTGKEVASKILKEYDLDNIDVVEISPAEKEKPALKPSATVTAANTP